MTYESFVAINNIAKERFKDKSHALRIKTEAYAGDDIEMGYVCDYQGQEYFMRIPEMMQMVYRFGAYISNPSAVKANTCWVKEERKNLAVYRPGDIPLKYHGCHPYIGMESAYHIATDFHVYVDDNYYMTIPEDKLYGYFGKSAKEKEQGVKNLLKEVNKLLVRQKREAFSIEEQGIIYGAIMSWLQGK